MVKKGEELGCRLQIFDFYRVGVYSAIDKDRDSGWATINLILSNIYCNLYLSESLSNPSTDRNAHIQYF